MPLRQKQVLTKIIEFVPVYYPASICGKFEKEILAMSMYGNPLRSASTQKRIFISFDYDTDRNYRYLLEALSKNPKFTISYSDATPGAIQSSDIGRIKAVLTGKIREATHCLVIVGAYANTPHSDQAKIGEINWQHWEIKQSIAEGKKLVGVKIAAANASPAPLLDAGAKWAMSFNVAAIEAAIDAA